jgi:intracellular sulfur oxidation DsrE/DsrF family protein
MEWTARFARRRFVSRLFAAVGLTGAASTGLAEARTSAAAEGRWQGASHPEDEWYDKIPGIHRFVFDTISPDGVSRALGFAGTYLEVNKSKYGLKDSDSAMIVICRNRSTRFGYNDAMWAKYGKQFSEAMDNFVDPKTKEVPKVNIHATAGGSMSRLIERGVQIAICEVATRGASSSLARALGGDADAYFKELSENLVPNGRLVPAGIVAVNRAQEHGYAVYAGG